ncbi:MCE family protein [uncultured Jatrophihabitans sp.]|uniref:MCE family protein n=1 Tax=uncultured Jatrophihabitans sp. TaxID=1610747 RepID=UPI0035CB64B0
MRGWIAPLIKLVIFLIVTAVATYVLAATISNASFGSTSTYKAYFTDVSGLELGDDVRIAGVRVGAIEDIAIKQQSGRNSVALVTFAVQKSRPLPSDVTAHLRYRNLVGQRYLDIEQGPGSTTSPMLTAAHPLPTSQTYPAVDLTVLFAGFQPLVQGLDPTQINKLSFGIIQTLQGEGGAFETLLANLADLTNALADKDQVIGEVIDNLSGVLQAVGQRDTELSDLIVQLKDFVGGLADDRDTIGNALDGINRLATSTSDLLSQVRAPLKRDIVDLTGLIGTINKSSGTLKYVLQQLPPTVATLIRTASYGSWFNFYLCSVSATATSGVTIGPKTLTIPASTNPAARCH